MLRQEVELAKVPVNIADWNPKTYFPPLDTMAVVSLEKRLQKSVASVRLHGLVDFTEYQ